MSSAEFFLLIGLYNEAFWLVIILTIILGILAVFLSLTKVSHSVQLISVILAFLWLWVGIVFGFLWFGSWTAIVFGIPIPGFGYFFGVIFTLQGILFLYYGVYRKSLSFEIKRSIFGVIGLILILFAIAFYWYVGVVTGHPFPMYPVFGTAPCPVFIFTVGFFLWADKRISPNMFILPTIQGLIGIIPILAFGIYADIVVFASGFICLFLIYRNLKWSDEVTD